MAPKPYHQGQLDFFCAAYALINALRLMRGLELPQARAILASLLRELPENQFLWQAVLLNRTDYYWLLDYMLGRFCREGPFALKSDRLPDFALSHPCGLPVPPGSPALPAASGRLAADASSGPPSPFGPFSPLSTPASLDPSERTGGAGSPDQAWRPAPASPPFCSLQALEAAGAYQPEAEFTGGPRPPRRWERRALWDLLRVWLPERGGFPLFGQNGPQERCLLLRFHRFMPEQEFPFISHWSVGQAFVGDTLLLYDCTADPNAVHKLSLSECALYYEELGPGRGLGLELSSLYFLEKT